MSARPETRRKRYACDAEYRRKCLANSRAYYRAHREEIRDRCREWRKARRKDPDYRFEERLRYKYRMTREDYERMLARQDGRCAICFRRPAQRLRVDHDHYTRWVRGLLCGKCNLGLGHFDDDLLTVLAAAHYLREAMRGGGGAGAADHGAGRARRAVTRRDSAAGKRAGGSRSADPPYAGAPVGEARLMPSARIRSSSSG